MASYKVFRPATFGSGERGLTVQTIEKGRYYEHEMWAVTGYVAQSSPMAEPVKAPEPAKPRKRKSGRRFNKFERELFATFERTQGRKACREAIALIRGEKTPEETMPWHGRNQRRSALWSALDRLLGTHGTEYLNNYQDETYHGPEVAYLNAGDTYAATLVYDHGRAYPWRIACWGDYAERYCRFED